MSDIVVELVIRHDAAEGMHEQRDTLLSVYEEIYADKLGDPFFTPARYWERLEAYASRSGFAMVTGALGGECIGYALGFTLPAGSGWWRGFQGSVTPDLLAEDGKRTFAITEIMVRKPWRRQGYAKALHDALLTDRQEARATLLVDPQNVPARRAYAKWGWEPVGSVKPFPDSPVYDALVLELDE